jgi:hypothetical protein
VNLGANNRHDDPIRRYRNVAIHNDQCMLQYLKMRSTLAS